MVNVVVSMAEEPGKCDQPKLFSGPMEKKSRFVISMMSSNRHSHIHIYAELYQFCLVWLVDWFGVFFFCTNSF